MIVILVFDLLATRFVPLFGRPMDKDRLEVQNFVLSAPA